MIAYATVFIAMFAYDWVWGKYAMAAADHRVAAACAYAGVMPFFIAFFSNAYVHDPKTAIPAAAGAIAGTWVAMRWGKRK